MALAIIPRYKTGVALTELDGTWYVVTAFDVFGYPSYRDAYEGWKLTDDAFTH